MATSPSDRGESGRPDRGDRERYRELVTDIAVIGAGPAGLSAAVAAADAGVTIALIDSEPAVGGQFWRHPAPTGQLAGVTDREVAALHHDLRHYHRLRRRLAEHVASGTVTYLARHEVWAVHARNAAGTAGAHGDEAGATDEARAAHDAEAVARAQARAPAGGDVPAGTPTSTRSGVSGGRARVRSARSGFVVEAVTGDPADRHTVTVIARAMVLATGAYDLQVPFPGWDLPGVMTAGGVQSLLKGHAVLAGRRVVVAGTGPFLLSVASGLVRAGASVPGVFEAASPRAWLREPHAVLSAGPKLLEGAGYAADLLRHRVAYRTGWTVLAAGGADRVQTVTAAPLDALGMPVTARSTTLHADILAVGWGFVPRLDLPLAVGCATAADGAGQPVIVVDADQRSTVAGVYAAGEICGVGGAALAAIEGEIAGAAAARDLAGERSTAGAERTGEAAYEAVGGLDRFAADPDRARLRRRRAALQTFADALQRVYPVPDGWINQVRDDTEVCRCEEVTAGAIREAAQRDGIADARSAKLLARPGMGWCQGRICGYATECLVAAAVGSVPEHRPTERAIATPVPLGVVARRGARPD